MEAKDRILKAVYKTIDETNELRDAGKQIDKNPDTILFGDTGHLDSMGLVNFIIALEEMIKEEFGEVIILADERAMSQKNSPFRTVNSFIEYIFFLLKEKNNV